MELTNRFESSNLETTKGYIGDKKMKTLDVLEAVLKGKQMRLRSQSLYKEAFNSFAQFSPDWPVSGMVVDEWVVSLKNYADTTIRMWYNLINAGGKYMEKVMGKNEYGQPNIPNPCNEATSPKVEKKRRRYWTVEELVSVIEACNTEQDALLISTLIDSSCRIGELGATSEHDGLRSDKIGKSWIDVKGKTGERRYRLGEPICERMREVAGTNNGYVFVSHPGIPATATALSNRVIRIVKRAGITGKKLGAHTFRHTSASLVARETGSALSVKALLQHDRIETSMIYIHDAEDEIQQKVSPLEVLGKRYAEGRQGRHTNNGIEVEQIEMAIVQDKNSESVSLVPIDHEVIEAKELKTDIFYVDMFPEIKDTVAVRPLLKAKELNLMRDIFIEYLALTDGRHAARLREFMNRMLRKVK